MLKDWEPKLLKKLTVVIQSIPSGKVASYGQVASLVGMPRGHRNVVRFLKYCEQDLHLKLPWHRVMRVDGKLGLEPDSNAYKTQRQRLTSEGVVLTGNRVNMKKYQWQPDMDFFLFHPDL